MVTITLCTRQQKRHWCIEQSYGLCGRGRGWEDLGEWHWNMYNIIYEMSHQSSFKAWYWMLGAGALGRPRGMVWGGRREEGSGWGIRVYLWRIQVDIWQNQYNIVKLNNKIKLKKKKKVEFFPKLFCIYWGDHLLFILQFIYVVIHIGWFVPHLFSLGIFPPFTENLSFSFPLEMYALFIACICLIHE